MLALLLSTISGCNPLGGRSTIAGGDGTGANGAVQPVLISPFSTNLSVIPVVISWTSTVTGFNITKFSVTNGSPQNFAGSGADYTFEVLPSVEGNVLISVAASAGTDPAGTPSTATVLTIRYDTTSPTVTINKTAAQSDTTGTLPLSYTVTFNEEINTGSFLDTDIVQNGTASGITWVITDSGDHKTFSLQATAISGLQGTVIPSLNAGSVTDVAGNINAASTTSGNTVTYLSNYSSIRLWLKADSLSSSNGAAVTTWPDSSAYNNNCSEATNPPSFVTNAQNSLPAVHFAGGSEILRSFSNSGISGNPDFTVFLVTRINGTGTNYPTFLQIGEGASNGLSAWFGMDSTSSNVFSGFYGGGSKSNSSYSPGFNLYTYVRDSGSGTNNTQSGNTQYWNGASMATTASLSAATVNITDGVFRIGRSSVNTTVSADIGEIIVFPATALSPAVRSEIETYLNGKWNLY